MITLLFYIGYLVALKDLENDFTGSALLFLKHGLTEKFKTVCIATLAIDFVLLTFIVSYLIFNNYETL